MRFDLQLSKEVRSAENSVPSNKKSKALCSVILVIGAVDFHGSNTAGSLNKSGRKDKVVPWRVHTELGCWGFLTKINVLIPPRHSSRFGGMISSTTVRSTPL